MKHIVHWYRRQSKSSRAILGCALLIGVFALCGLGSAARQSLAMVATSTPISTPTSTPTPILTPTATPPPTPKSANTINPFSGQPWLTHQATSNVWTQQMTLPKPSATSVNKVLLHTTPTPQATATTEATAAPQGTPQGTATPTPTATPQRTSTPQATSGTATPPSTR